jgi:hypothetical protein
MQQKYFETSFGHRIPIVPDYRRHLPPPRDNDSALGASSIQQSMGAKGPEESDFGILSDIFQFGMMADWFDRTAVSDRCYNRMLDIGGSTGLMGQLFKAAGRARAVENIEILDFRDSLELDRVRFFLKTIQDMRRELSFPARSRVQELKTVLLRPGIRSSLRWFLEHLNFMQSTFPYPIGEHSNYWKLNPGCELGLDRYILGDLFELDEKYDFLLCATTMQHFSVPSFLRKAYSLLESGGVLFIWNAYWYWVLLVIRVYGDFPWGAQRLTWEDYSRYLREYQPDQVDNARKSVETFHKAEMRYTVADYIAAAKQAGFKYVDHHRLIPFSGIKNKIGGHILEGDHGASVQKEVLRDIHCFRQDIELIDLATQSVFLLFQKE